MDIWNTLKTTLLLNVGCSLVQVASCALAGYGFARFKFKGKGILFGIVVMMILVPAADHLHSPQFGHLAASTTVVSISSAMRGPFWQ